MKAKWSKCLLLGCLLIGQMTILSTTLAANGGAIAGGGGDASEARVNEIRTDILNWINIGGAKGLALDSLDYNEYVRGMQNILTPKKVVIGFVEKDHSTDSDFQVNINGKPKTCRGFMAKDNNPRILCNIARFEATPEADQYSLIHHEYAGLVGFEENDGSYSDYHISNQLTGFLTRQKVLKLAIKKLNPQEFELPTVEMTKVKYLGDNEFRVTLELKNTKDVLQVVLEKGLHTFASNECFTEVPNLNFMNGEKNKVLTLKNKCGLTQARFQYGKVTVQFIDGSVKNLGDIKFAYGFKIKNTVSILDTNVKVLKEEVGTPVKPFYGQTLLKAFNLNFQLSYKATAEMMKDYDGVIFYDGKPYSQYQKEEYAIKDKEFLSSDPQALADAVNAYNEIRDITVLENYVSEKVCKSKLLSNGKCFYKNTILPGYFIQWSYMYGAASQPSGIIFIRKGNKVEYDVQMITEVGKGKSRESDSKIYAF